MQHRCKQAPGKHAGTLLQHAQDAYIAAFKSTIAQYRPSMISEDHTNMIVEMIDNIANDTEEILNTHLKEVVE